MERIQDRLNEKISNHRVRREKLWGLCTTIHNVINNYRPRHSRESGNPERHWIPGQARNDEAHETYVVMYNVQIL